MPSLNRPLHRCAALLLALAGGVAPVLALQAAPPVAENPNADNWHWFALVLAALALVGLGLYRWRLRQTQTSERLLQEIVEALPIAVVVADIEEQAHLVNARFVETFGYTHAQVRRLDDWWPLAYPGEPRMRAAWQRRIKPLLRRGVTPAPQIAEVTCHDGTRRVIEFRYQPLGTRFIVTLNDVTERERAKERFTKAFHANLVPMSITRLSDRAYLEANESFLQLCERPRAAVIGQTGEALGFDVDQTRLARFYARLRAAGSLRNFEATMRFPSGPRTTLATAELITLGGEPCVLWSHQDISERKRAEERFQQAFHANPAPLLIVRASDRVVLEVNASLLRLSGFTRAELLGQSGDLLNMDVPLERRRQAYARVTAGGSIPNLEATLRFPAGTRTVLVSGAAVTLGGEACVLWSLLDITERKRAEEKFTRLFQSNPCELWIVRLADRRILGVNQQWEQGTGYTRAEALGRTAAELGLPVSPAAVDALYEELRQKGAVRGLEMEFQDRHGRRTSGLFSGELLEIDGETCVLWSLQDISARKRAEERFQKAFDHNPTAMSISSLRTRKHLAVNDSYLRLSGFTRAEMLGKDMVELGFGVDLAVRENFYARLRQTGALKNFEGRVRFKNGEFVMLASAELLTLDGEECVLWSFQDITERKQVEEALRASEQRYRSLVEAQTEFLVRWRPDGTRTFVNDSYCRFYGLTPAAALGTSWIEAEKMDILAPLLENLAALTPAQPVYEHDLRLPMPDGTVHWEHWNNRAFFDETGRIVEYQSVGRDITARKQAEEIAQRWQSVFAQTEFALAHTSVADDTILDINEAYARARGYTRAELLGQSVFVIYPPELRADIKQRLQEVHRQGHYVFETIHQRKDGSRFPVLLELNVIRDAQGQPVARISYALDISERKQAEADLQASELRYRSLVEDQTDFVARWRPDGTRTFVNDSYCRFFELTRETALRASWLPATLDAATRAQLAELAALTPAQPVLQIEHRFKRPNGAVVWTQWSNRAFFDDAGRIVEYQSVGRDITARKQTEAALQASEAKFRALAESSLLSITIYNEAGFHYVNPATERLLGYTADELARMDWRDLLHPEARALAEERRQTRLAGGALPAHREIKLVNKAGAPLWIDYAIGAIELDGRPYEISTCLDITARKQTEAALRASEAKFRTLTETTQVTISIFDEHGFVYANPAMEQLYGYTAAELARLNWRALLHPDAQAYGEQRHQARLRGLAVSPRDELKVLKKDGTAFWVSFSIGEIELAGQPYRLATTFDITERKLAEEELRSSEAKFRALAETTQVAIAIFDKYDFVYANPAMEQMYGYTQAELRRLDWRDLVHPDARAQAEQRHLARVRGEHVTPRNVIKAVKKDGTVCWVDYSVSDIELAGRPHRITTAVDITERKLAEEELRASREQLRNLAARLQSIREEERSAIAREIHDELGQALTGIKMDLKWLEKELPPDARPARERLASVYGLIGTTIQNVRQLATSLRPGVLDDFGLAAALEWQAHEFETRTGIVCVFEELPEDLPLERDSATAIFRIFQETLTNVARHAEATRVNVRVGVHLAAAGAMLRLQIHDNGRGITAHEIAHTRSLGLVGMRERARLLGGTFELQGRPGAGTTVLVEIPLNHASKAEEQV